MSNTAPLLNEEFLYYLWRFQYFDKKDLCTHQADTLHILQPGIQNANAGPDFKNASILINQVTWHGHVEIHVNASEWYQHHHQNDPAYDNVILHVVWNHDQAIQQRDGTPLPTLVLKDRVTQKMLGQYQQLIHTKTTIPCAHQLPYVKDLIKHTMLDKALFERLKHKNSLVYRLLEGNTGDWEETAYQLLAHNFGFKVNSSPLLELSLCLPLKIIKRNACNLLQLEALLFGHAGLLTATSNVQDDYPMQLSKAYSYLTHKYNIKQKQLNQCHWQFFRLRPANFPTIRIAQLAKLLHQHQSIFTLLVHHPYKDLYKQLAVLQSPYWQHHYQFKKQGKAKIPGIGIKSIENILINTVVPLLVAYGKLKDKQDYIDKAVTILQNLPAEHNKITRHWEHLGIKAKSAFDSQALIELFNNFCLKKKCLSCNIGVSLLQKKY